MDIKLLGKNADSVNSLVERFSFWVFLVFLRVNNAFVEVSNRFDLLLIFTHFFVHDFANNEDVLVSLSCFSQFLDDCLQVGSWAFFVFS